MLGAVSRVTITQDEYLAAFMSGFEFVLLGIEGRLHDAKLDARARAELLAFVRDYQRVVQEHRERGTPEGALAFAVLARRN